MTTKEQVLQNCTVEGNVVKLPNCQLERKLYMDVAKALELIGGKWKGGKVFGFVFESDPTDLLEQIANGEKRNLKKEFQFFATPEPIADWLVELANIQPTDSVLEPSAGQGAIIAAIYRAFPYYPKTANDLQTVTVDYCELMEVNQSILSKKIAASERWSSATSFMGDDFFELDRTGYYDRIIANPPFSKNQDIEHIFKMYSCLKEDGILVSVASKHWQNSSNRKEANFREWLDEVNAGIHEIESGAFKDSGTMVGTVVIVIGK